MAARAPNTRAPIPKAAASILFAEPVELGVAAAEEADPEEDLDEDPVELAAAPVPVVVAEVPAAVLEPEAEAVAAPEDAPEAQVAD